MAIPTSAYIFIKCFYTCIYKGLGFSKFCNSFGLSAHSTDCNCSATYICNYNPCVSSNAVLSQECFPQPNCVGSSFTVSSARECCAGTEEGMSYSEGGTCTVTQCIGEK